MASTDELANDVRTSAGTPIGKVRVGSLPSTAHPLVSTLYQRLKERTTRSFSSRCGKGRGPRSRPGWRMAALTSRRILIERQSHRRMATFTSSRHQPISSARPVIPSYISADGALFSTAQSAARAVCRPSSWRNHLEQIGAERKVSLNVALEADLLSLQTHIASQGGIYALLGPYAIAAASYTSLFLQSSKLVDPVVPRHITALAMSRHGNLTLACRTVMELARDIAKSGAAALRRS